MAADLTKLASQLVRDLKTAFWLPPYDTANVSKVIEQMVELHDRAKAEQEVPSFDSQDPRDTCAPMVLLLAMIRNRDLLVSYLRCAAAAAQFSHRRASQTLLARAQVSNAADRAAAVGHDGLRDR